MDIPHSTGEQPGRARDERGSMLIVALGILALLSVLALTFVKLMNLERAATLNYVDGVRSRLVAEGGLSAAMDQLARNASAKAFVDARDETWIYGTDRIFGGPAYGLPLEESTHLRPPRGAGALDPINQRKSSYAGDLGESYNNGVDRYKIKVLDAQSQFNLNLVFEEVSDTGSSELVDATFVRMVDALGVAISYDLPNTGYNGNTPGSRPNPIAAARYPRGSSNPARGGMAIYKFRQSRPGGRFTSKTELLEVLASEEHFEILRDYVTCHAWTDPKTVSAKASGDRMNREPWTEVAPAPHRSPININLASVEVMTAALAGIRGRGIFTWTGDLDQQAVDAGTDYSVAQSVQTGVTNKVETHRYESHGLIVYIPPFGYRRGGRLGDAPNIWGALNFARLIKRRVNEQGPFRSFAEWESWLDRGGGGQFRGITEVFLETNDAVATSAKAYSHWDEAVIKTLQDQDLSTGAALGIPADALVRQDPAFRPWFVRAVASMLKANFNPNARLSSWNNDDVVHLPIDKGGLRWKYYGPVNPSVYPGNDWSRQLHLGQSVEWCFAPKGVFEITSLGEILGDIPADVTKQVDLNQDGEIDKEIYAQAKVRGVLKLFDTAIVRTQQDFEGGNLADFTGDADGDGLPNRFGMASYPVPKIYWEPVNGSIQYSQYGSPAGYYEQLANGNLSGDRDPSNLSGYLQLATRLHDPSQSASSIQVSPLGQGVGTSGNGFARLELLFQRRHNQTGRPEDALQADVADNTPGPALGGGAAGTFHTPYGDAIRGVNEQGGQNRGFWTNQPLTPDGYYNNSLRANQPGSSPSDGTELWYRASCQNAFDPANPENNRAPSNLWAPGGAAEATARCNYGNVSPLPVGAIEFWWKPDFDWTIRSGPGGGGSTTSGPTTSINPRFCGLLAVTSLMENVQGQITETDTGTPCFSRGTQMFVTRTTSGELRVTRLYFEMVGSNPTNSIPYVLGPPDPASRPELGVLGLPAPTTAPSSMLLFNNPQVFTGTPAGYYQNVANNQEYTWPPYELLLEGNEGEYIFNNVRFARTDHWVLPTAGSSTPVGDVSMQNWRAHEWHHIALRWDDRGESGWTRPPNLQRNVPGHQAGEGRDDLEVWLDGQQVLAAGHPLGPMYAPIVGYDPNAGGAPIPHPTIEWQPSFVRLNGVGKTVGGQTIAPVRDEVVVGSVRRDQSDRGGLFKYEREVRLPANGTLDDVRFFDGARNVVTEADQVGNGTFTGRYEDDGAWRGEIDISDAFDTPGQQIELGSLQVTAYLPTKFRQIEDPTGDGRVTLRFQVERGGALITQGSGPNENWEVEMADLIPTGSGPANANTSVRLLDNGEPFRVRATDRLFYSINIEPAFFGGSMPVASPVVDDVTLVYRLPSAQILVKERVNN